MHKCALSLRARFGGAPLQVRTPLDSGGIGRPIAVYTKIEPWIDGKRMTIALIDVVMYFHFDYEIDPEGWRS